MVCTIHMYQLKTPSNSLLVQVSATSWIFFSLRAVLDPWPQAASRLLPVPPHLWLLLCVALDM